MAEIISILLTAIIIIVSVLLVLIVLVQRPKQEGLGAAFGGGAFDSALGAHTTDILQKITTYLAVIFFTSAIGLAMVKARQFSASPASNVLENVDKRDQAVPEMPSSISNFPDLGGEGDTTSPAPTLLDSVIPPVSEPKADEGAAADKTPDTTPAPAADTPKPAEAQKGDAPAEKGKAKASEAKGKAKAENTKGKAKAEGKGKAKGE